MLSISLPVEAEQLLSSLAKEKGQTLEDFARTGVLRYLENMEELKIAEQRSLEISQGLSSTNTLFEVMKKYGMDN